MTIGTTIVSIEVSGMAGVITSLTLNVDITHTFIGDLQIDLTGPGGTVTLMDSLCGGNDNLNVTFDDSAASAVGTGCASPYTGTFRSQSNSLSGFIGENPNFTWTLTVHDQFSGDTGTLNNATLSITSA